MCFFVLLLSEIERERERERWNRTWHFKKNYEGFGLYIMCAVWVECGVNVCVLLHVCKKRIIFLSFIVFSATCTHT